MERPALILGLESSCDETAVAVVTSDKRILSHIVASQIAQHSPYGGVVPEIAARQHVEVLSPLVGEALAQAGVALADIDAIAATAGPGLIGGVMVGLVTAKSLCIAARKPLIAVNHLEGHALSPRLVQDVAFPYLLLLTSGGHCQLLLVAGVGRYQRLATTIDDAAGEAFDKVAKMLKLGFPGGPAVEKLAMMGNPKGFDLPRPLLGRKEPHFSFAGLKSAVLRLLESGAVQSEHHKADLAASFQQAVIDCMIDRTSLVLSQLTVQPTALVVAGGVAANGAIRSALAACAAAHQLAFVAPPLWLCTDNGAMIAWAGAERFALGLFDTLEVPARARWPLDLDAEKARGAGVKA
jgi:N6-L-threonylcarbamoyladenine synthase